MNISEQQLQHAQEKCRGLSVDFLNRDYRSIDGIYDKVVSVGMFEHVAGRSQTSCRDDNLSGFPGVRDAAAPPQEEPRPFRPPESVQPMQ